VVPSSGSSRFLAKVTHNYDIQNVTVELKLIKIDKKSKIKTGRFPLVAVYATCKQISKNQRMYGFGGV
jgi:hypothetical protein